MPNSKTRHFVISKKLRETILANNFNRSLQKKDDEIYRLITDPFFLSNKMNQATPNSPAYSRKQHPIVVWFFHKKKQTNFLGAVLESLII